MDNNPQRTNHFDKLSLELKWHILSFTGCYTFGKGEEEARTARKLRLVNRQNSVQFLQPVARSLKLLVMLNDFGLRQLEWFADSNLGPYIQHVQVVGMYLWNLKLVLAEPEVVKASKQCQRYSYDQMDAAENEPALQQHMFQWNASQYVWAERSQSWYHPSTHLTDLASTNITRTPRLPLLRLEDLDEHAKASALDEEEASAEMYDRAAALLQRFPVVHHVSVGLVTNVISALGIGDGVAENREVQFAYVDVDLEQLDHSFGTPSRVSGIAHLSELADRITTSSGNFGEKVQTLDLRCSDQVQGGPIPSLASVENMLAVFKNIKRLTFEHTAEQDPLEDHEEEWTCDLTVLGHISSVLSQHPLANLDELVLRSRIEVVDAIRLIRAHRDTLRSLECRDQASSTPQIYCAMLQLVKDMPHLMDIRLSLDAFYTMPEGEYDQMTHQYRASSRLKSTLKIPHFESQGHLCGVR